MSSKASKKSPGANRPISGLKKSRGLLREWSYLLSRVKADTENCDEFQEEQIFSEFMEWNDGSSLSRLIDCASLPQMSKQF